MKKLLISFGTVLIVAFVLVSFVNATETDKDKKAKVEVKKVESMPCSAKCNLSAEEKASCNPAACAGVKEKKCDPATCTAHNGGKCDPATCAAHKEGGKMEGKACGSSASCCKAKTQK